MNVGNANRRTENVCRWFFFPLVMLLAFSLPSAAQRGRTTDMGAIVGAKYAAPLWGDAEVEVEEELRFEGYQGVHLERWLTGLTFETPVTPIPWLGKRLHLGLHGGYVRHHVDQGYFDHRWRTGVDLSYYETFQRFKFTYRSRFLCTFRDERTGDYQVNPKWYWRNKLQATYQQMGSRFKYTLSAECFWRLRALAKDSFVDHLRTTFAVNYRLTRRQSITGFIRMDNELQVKKPFDRFYLGLTYQLKY